MQLRTLSYEEIRGVVGLGFRDIVLASFWQLTNDEISDCYQVYARVDVVYVMVTLVNSLNVSPKSNWQEVARQIVSRTIYLEKTIGQKILDDAVFYAKREHELLIQYQIEVLETKMATLASVCPTCNKPMEIIFGKYGYFRGCPGRYLEMDCEGRDATSEEEELAQQRQALYDEISKMVNGSLSLVA